MNQAYQNYLKIYIKMSYKNIHKIVILGCGF